MSPERFVKGESERTLIFSNMSNLFRNVPFLTSLEVSPFLLICCCPWGDRRSEALRRGLCGAFRV
jgi:hypothetical protein